MAAEHHAALFDLDGLLVDSRTCRWLWVVATSKPRALAQPHISTRTSARHARDRRSLGHRPNKELLTAELTGPATTNGLAFLDHTEGWQSG